MADPPIAQDTTSAVDWETVQASPDFAKLRHALRSFVFPVTIAFLVWYFTVRAVRGLRPRLHEHPGVRATSPSG